MLTIANRLQATQEYYFSKKLREIAALNAEGKDIINLGIGSPDLAPPRQAVEKLVSTAKNENNHGYQSYKGIPALRNAFSEWYKKYYDVALDPENEILPLIGSKEGITYISKTYLNEGDEVLVPDPGYPAYAAATQIAGGVVTTYDLKEENNWLPDLKALAVRDLSKVKIMWINYPNMPTGAKASIAIFEELVHFAEENNILLCHDNPYSFILNEEPLSIFAAKGISDHVLELNSLSKSHNMAGWRIGMVAGSKQHINNILIAKSNVDSGMFLAIQQAAVEALNQPQEWYNHLNQIYKNRREIVWQIMELLDCNYDRDQSGLFIWGKIPEQINETDEFVDEILQEAGVFITPGYIFGANGNRFIRISLCSDEKRLNEALQRIEKIITLKNNQ